MKKLLHASCLAFAVWLTTVPALADIIVEPRPRPRPRPPQELNVLVAVLLLGVVAIAVALLARTVLRMRRARKL